MTCLLCRMDEILKKTAEDIVENTIACPDVVPPNNCKYCIITIEYFERVLYQIKLLLKNII